MNIQLHPAPLAKTAATLREGERAPRDYVDVLCDRIDAVDDDLRAFRTERGRRERVRVRATVLDSLYPESLDRPELFGVPVGVKDIFHVDDFETRAGSALPPELIAGTEAQSVVSLREAGAIVLGKTITTEFAGMAPGLTRNPHDLDHTPGGSSSGSAAAVAAGLCPLALGTQTIGSVIRPAAFCGVVGFKPSFDRIPTDGVVPFSRSADHVGTFTQDLAGASLVASVLCSDWSTVERPLLGELRVGVPEGSYLDRASSSGLGGFEEQIQQLEMAGVDLVRRSVPAFERFEDLKRRHYRLTRAEFAEVHADWFDDYRAFYRTVTADNIEVGRAVSDTELEVARESRFELRSALHTYLDDHNLDVIASPAARGPAPLTIRSTGDPVMNFPWTHAGLPTVSIPAGMVEDGLPLGLQLTGRFGADEALLATAQTVDAAMKAS